MKTSNQTESRITKKDINSVFCLLNAASVKKTVPG